jgi:hypothetical protein
MRTGIRRREDDIRYQGSDISDQISGTQIHEQGWMGKDWKASFDWLRE